MKILNTEINCRNNEKKTLSEMSYLRGGCGVNRMDGECNENLYRKFGMSSRGEGMSCGVVEMVRRSTLIWFGHMERMDET